MRCINENAAPRTAKLLAVNKTTTFDPLLSLLLLRIKQRCGSKIWLEKEQRYYIYIYQAPEFVSPFIWETLCIFKNSSACQNVKVILVGKMRILNLLGGFKYKSYVLLILYLQSLSKFKNNMTTEFRFVNMKKKYVGFFSQTITWFSEYILIYC